MSRCRVALWIDLSLVRARWAARLVAEVRDDSDLELAGLIIDQRRPRRGNRIIDGLLAIERTALTPANAEETFEAEPELKIGRIDDPNLSTADIGAVNALDADVIVKAADGDAPPAIVAGGARIWTYDFVVDRSGGTVDFGIGEVRRRANTTRATLEEVSPTGKSRRPLAHAVCKTGHTAALNIEFAKDRAVSITLRELRRSTKFASEEPADEESVATAAPFNAGDAAAYCAAVGTTIVRKAARRAIDKAREISGRLDPAFGLCYGEGGVETADLSRSWAIPTEERAFYADPFLFIRSGVPYVFFEKYCYRRGKGVISVGRIDGSDFVFLGDALETDSHLSYPFVFEHDGEIYMLPETHQNNRLELWRCRTFPLVWELVRTAMEGVSAADTSMVEHDGAWWLFTNIASGTTPDHNTELSIFQMKDPLLTGIVPHPRNPVVIDARVARGAGRIVRSGDRLIRPSQDNSRDVYGYGLNLMEITRLHVEGYEERPLKSIVGSHHVDFLDGRFVCDVRRGQKAFGALGEMRFIDRG